MHVFNAMNTTITTLGLSEYAREQVESWFRFVEHKLSRFTPDSELSQLNRSAGAPFAASALLYQVMSVADAYHTATEGLFNPYLGSVLENLGYNKSFEQIGLCQNAEQCTAGWQLTTRRVTVTEAAAASVVPRQAAKPVKPVKLDPSARTITIPPGISVDLGGIAKGWSADQISTFLQEDGIASGVVDAGGDIICWGNEAAGLQVAIADPFTPERDIVDLVLKRQAGIATSNTLKRRWSTAGGRSYHHLLDPRTLTSSESDLVQVTVLAPNVTTAEVYAKCILLLGAEEGMAWIEHKQPDLGVIAVRSDHSVIVGRGLKLYCELTEHDLIGRARVTCKKGVAAHERLLRNCDQFFTGHG